MKSKVGRAIVPAALALILASYPAAAANDQAAGTKSKRASQRVQQSSSVMYPSLDGIGATCAYDRAAGRCMIDLGNGRCMECNAGPMK